MKPTLDAAPAFQHADLYALHRLLRAGGGKGCQQRSGGSAGKNWKTAHEEISG